MPTIKVSNKVYQAIIVEAGKRGCTIGQAADALFDNAPVELHNKPAEVKEDGRAKPRETSEGLKALLDRYRE